MARAQETGAIISSFLSEDLPVSHCSLLREGAPIPPEPKVGGWRPEALVCLYHFSSFNMQ